jgi:2-polyprenyl-3-methyl-5-hydroxy-6-metoxy-1,4-benzoquinol methylase
MIPVSSSNQHKYANKNRVHQYMLRRFLDAAHREIMRLSPASILDFGCGEGFFLKAMLDRGMPKDCQVTGIDIRNASVAMAKDLCPMFRFDCTDLFKLIPEKENYDLVMAIEILEHLTDPGPYLQHLTRLCRKNLLLTVPNEPWFRLMNFLRGRNIVHLGDHPEHINHWSLAAFGSWVRSYLIIDKLYSVFPWVILVANK